MALTPTEEAQVRQLLAEQAELLTLAANETTIMSKLGATKVTLADLTAATSLSGSDLFLVRQGVTDKKVTRDTIAEDVKRTGLANSIYLNNTPTANAAFTITRALTSFTAPYAGKVFAVQSVNIGGAGVHPAAYTNTINITGSTSGSVSTADNTVAPMSCHASLSVVSGETVNVTGTVSGVSTSVTWNGMGIHTSYIFVPTA